MGIACLSENSPFGRLHWPHRSVGNLLVSAESHMEPLSSRIWLPTTLVIIGHHRKILFKFNCFLCFLFVKVIHAHKIQTFKKYIMGKKKSLIILDLILDLTAVSGFVSSSLYFFQCIYEYLLLFS